MCVKSGKELQQIHTEEAGQRRRKSPGGEVQTVRFRDALPEGHLRGKEISPTPSQQRFSSLGRRISGACILIIGRASIRQTTKRPKGPSTNGPSPRSPIIQLASRAESTAGKKTSAVERRCARFWAMGPTSPVGGTRKAVPLSVRPRASWPRRRRPALLPPLSSTVVAKWSPVCEAE